MGRPVARRRQILHTVQNGVVPGRPQSVRFQTQDADKVVHHFGRKETHRAEDIHHLPGALQPPFLGDHFLGRFEEKRTVVEALTATELE